MKMKKNDYFEMMVSLIGYSCRAADMLCEYLRKESKDSIDGFRTRIHEIEHAADIAKHDVMAKLVREFITPIERDDILALVNIIDDITDSLDDVPIKLYIYAVPETGDEIASFAEKVRECVYTTREVVSELASFRKSEHLSELIVRVNDLETEADDMHIDAIHRLFEERRDPLTLISLKAVYDSLEECCDLCEHAADIVETTILKNI